MEEFKNEYHCITMDLRNAKGGQSSGPLEIDRPWDAYADDQLGLMDHLGIKEFMVMGFCIGGPFIWNLLKRAPERIVAAVLAQPSGFVPRCRTCSTRTTSGLGPAAVRAPARDHHGHGRRVPDEDVPRQSRLRLHRDAGFRAQLQDADPGAAGRCAGASVCGGDGERAPGAERRGEHLSVEGDRRNRSPRRCATCGPSCGHMHRSPPPSEAARAGVSWVGGFPWPSFICHGVRRRAIHVCTAPDKARRRCRPPPA